MMETKGKVLNLFIGRKGLSQRFPQHELKLDQQGVQNDKFYAKDIERSVLIVSTESYTLAKQNGISLRAGTLGENILVDFNPYTLPIGKELQIGRVKLKISQHGTLCSHLSKVNNMLPKLLKESRGIFAHVTQAGSISLGDELRI